MSTDKERPPYVKVAWEIERLAGDEVKTKTKELMLAVADNVKELVWQVANDYIENYADSEPLRNYSDRVENEVFRCSHIWVKEEGFWGKNLRAKLLEEHREEILPLLRTEYIAKLEEEVKRLADLAEFRGKLLNSNRY
jgi:hypothetical protein